MSGRIGVVQKPIPSTLRSSGCEEYEDDRGSSLLSAEMCEISENVEKTLRVSIQDICSSFGKNQKQFRAATGKKLMGFASGNFSDFERQKQRG